MKFIHYGIFAIKLKRLSDLDLCKKTEKITHIWQKLLILEFVRNSRSGPSANVTLVDNSYGSTNERKIDASFMVK